jgi:hypothetical protein
MINPPADTQNHAIKVVLGALAGKPSSQQEHRV